MKEENVLLTIQGTQYIPGERPQRMELTTAGTMQAKEDRYVLSYVETAVTGLDGTRTTFDVWRDKIVLTRTGTFNSRMAFIPGTVDRSLYDTGCGAMLMEVRANSVKVDLKETGGQFDIDYTVRLEQAAAGRMRYHIVVQKGS